MRKQNVLERVKKDLEAARQMVTAAENERASFCRPFEKKEAEHLRALTDRQRELNGLKADRFAALGDDSRAEEVDLQIEKTERAIRRQVERLRIAKAWRQEQSAALAGFQQKIRDAELDFEAASVALAEATMDDCLVVREQYVDACGNLWDTLRKCVGLRYAHELPVPLKGELDVTRSILEERFGRLAVSGGRLEIVGHGQGENDHVAV